MGLTLMLDTRCLTWVKRGQVPFYFLNIKADTFFASAFWVPDQSYLLGLFAIIFNLDFSDADRYILLRGRNRNHGNQRIFPATLP